MKVWVKVCQHKEEKNIFFDGNDLKNVKCEWYFCGPKVHCSLATNKNKEIKWGKTLLKRTYLTMEVSIDVERTRFHFFISETKIIRQLWSLRQDLSGNEYTFIVPNNLFGVTQVKLILGGLLINLKILGFYVTREMIQGQ